MPVRLGTAFEANRNGGRGRYYTSAHSSIDIQGHTLLTAEQEVQYGSYSLYGYRLRDQAVDMTSQPLTGKPVFWACYLATAVIVENAESLGKSAIAGKRGRDKLVEHNLLLCKKRAIEMYRDVPGFDSEEKFACGRIGLIRAAEKYDPTKLNPSNGKPYRFTTYAHFWIKQAITRAFLGSGSFKIPEGKNSAWVKWQECLEVGSDTHEMALEVWGENYQQKIDHYSRATCVASFNWIVSKDGGMELQDLIPENTQHTDTTATIARILEASEHLLTEREQKVLRLRYFAPTSSKAPTSFQVIAERIGCNPEQAQRVGSNLVKKLRVAAQNGELEPILAH